MGTPRSESSPIDRGRGVDDTYSALLEVVEPIAQLVIAQAVVAEVEHRFYHALGHMVDDPSR